MQIDLTDAAAAYGLDYVPKIVWNDEEFRGNAGFIGEWREIHVGPDHLTEPPYTCPDTLQRFERVVGHPLSSNDALRFTFAHELYHAVQWRDDPDEFERTAMLELLYGEHDADHLEIEADQHAAKVYPLVKVTP